MNKRRSKALKELADMLPDAYIFRSHTETGTLEDMIALRDAGTEIAGLPELDGFNNSKIMSITYDATEVLNHHKRLKKAWQDGKTEGIQNYILWLGAHNRATAIRMKNMKIEQVDDRLLSIARKNIGAFWSSLITFLIAFAASFLNIKADTDDTTDEAA